MVSSLFSGYPQIQVWRKTEILGINVIRKIEHVSYNEHNVTEHASFSLVALP